MKPCKFSSDLLSRIPFITLINLNAVARGKRLALNYYQRFMHANPALDCTIGSLNDDPRPEARDIKGAGQIRPNYNFDQA